MNIIASLLVVTVFLIAELQTVASWEYPWDECKDMDQIVGRKCEVSYYVCDFGDTWFTKEVLCNNCIGDCPPGRVFDNATETCLWPETIGCGCTQIGQTLGTKCEDRFYVCELDSDDWATEEVLCNSGTVFDPDTNSCKPSEDLGC